MKPKTPKLHWVLPGAPFEVVDPSRGSYWEGVIADGQSDDTPHFECRRGTWTEEEIVKAGARECQESRGVVLVRRFEKGLPVSCNKYAVQYAWGKWFLNRMDAKSVK